jgi:hypothetical protein
MTPVDVITNVIFLFKLYKQFIIDNLNEWPFATYITYRGGTEFFSKKISGKIFNHVPSIGIDGALMSTSIDSIVSSKFSNKKVIFRITVLIEYKIIKKHMQNSIQKAILLQL